MEIWALEITAKQRRDTPCQATQTVHRAQTQTACRNLPSGLLYPRTWLLISYHPLAFHTSAPGRSFYKCPIS